MIINLFLLIYKTFSNSLIQLNWFYFELFLLNECNSSIFLFTLCEFAIWIFLIVSNISSFSVVALHPIQIVVPTIIIECGWNSEWIQVTRYKHCLHLSIFLCSKQSISHCQPSFLMFTFLTLFQSLKLRSHNLFHSISSIYFL